MYNNRAYIIRTKANLHVGDGGTNFDIVDKEVQKDSISKLPVIHGSSLKGAIKDHFEYFKAKNNDTDSVEQVKPFVFDAVFGAEEEKKDGESEKKQNSKQFKQGLVKFIEAKLLFLPLRSNNKPFYHVTSKSNLQEMVDFLNMLDIDIDIDIDKDIDKDITNNQSIVFDKCSAIVEDVECASSNVDVSKIKELFNIKNLALFNDEDFNEAVASLPVIARNNIKNPNLWYEEMVPRESIFYTVFAYSNSFDNSDNNKKWKSDGDKFHKAYELFETKLCAKPIEIGANISTGYGICDFKKMPEIRESNE